MKGGYSRLEFKNNNRKNIVNKTGVASNKPKKNKNFAGKLPENQKSLRKFSDNRKPSGKIQDNRKTEGKSFEKGKKESKALCPVFNKCGGCQLLHMPYNKQLEWKQKRVQELIGNICEVESVIGMKEPDHYRCKVHHVFGHDRKGNALHGIYQEGSHKVVPITTCLLEDRKADEIIETVRSLLKSFKIKTYDEDYGQGLLRHVLIRIGKNSGQVMVVLVVSNPIFPSSKNFVKALVEKHPEITTIVLNVNDKHTSMVLGDKEKPIYGKGYITDEVCGMTFKISPKSFYQVNPVQTERLYSKAIELAKLKKTDVVMDCYSGVGTIGIIASPHVKEVISVELNKDAVKDAIWNSRANNAENVTFYNNDATRFMAQMAESNDRVDVVIMDPPRSGATEEFLKSLFELAPERVSYISCSPDTLARDLKIMVKNGYKVEKVVPVDMFAYTKSIETVAVLSRIGD